MRLKIAVLIVLLGLVVLGSKAQAENNDIDVSKLKQKVTDMQSGRQSYTVIEADLERTNKELLDAENALLEQAKEPTDERDAVKKAIQAQKQSEIQAKTNTAAAATKAKSSFDLTPVEPKKATLVVSDKDLANAAVERLQKFNSMEQELTSVRQDATQTLKDKEKTIQRVNAEKLACEQKLGSHDQKVSGLVNELTETKNKLMLAETEVERLSHLLNQYTKDGLAHYAKINLKDNNPVTPISNPAPIRPKPQAAPERAVEPDMPVATVVTDKAYLRTGPGKENSPLMTVKQGTRLAVETRDGAWFRVIAPTGTRAWVDAEVIAFGANGKNVPSETVEIKAFGGDKEDEAFKLIHGRLAASK